MINIIIIIMQNDSLHYIIIEPKIASVIAIND